MAVANSLHTPLERPPVAFSLTVRKLLGKVHTGQIRVPVFQRPLRWAAPDVVKLFDSILRGYPIGSLLFWKQSMPEDPQLKIGNAVISAPAVAEGWYIVDGQQRTTALAAALLELNHSGDRRWTIRYDPTEGRFLSGEASPTDAKRHVPGSVLGDLRRLGKWLRDCDLDEDEQNHVETVQQRLLDYELPAYLMENEDVDALRGVFARLNSTGVRMRADEVFQALLGASDKTAGQVGKPIDLAALQQRCDLDQFGQPPRSEVLKALLAMSGLDPTKRLEELGETVVKQSLVDPSEASDALQRAVAFLQGDPSAPEPGVGIPAYALLPYPVVFVILAKWFYVFPEPDAAIRRELSRWVWRGIATGVHHRGSVSAMRLQVREITDDMQQSLNNLLRIVGEIPRLEWTQLDRFNTTHAASRVELLTLLNRIPRDRNGPIHWRVLLSAGERIAREIVRSQVWRTLGDDAKRLARTAANRALLDTQHTGVATELSRWTWADDREALQSHLLDEAAFATLKAGDYSLFLKQRAALVKSAVSTFLAERAGLGEPVLFPVASYFEEKDDQPEASATILGAAGR